jgi:hypothetical protein
MSTATRLSAKGCCPDGLPPVFVDVGVSTGEVDEAGFRIRGDLRPDADVAGPLPSNPFFPGVVAEFAPASESC